jgi:hypothetical protein
VGLGLVGNKLAAFQKLEQMAGEQLKAVNGAKGAANNLQKVLAQKKVSSKRYWPCEDRLPPTQQ